MATRINLLLFDHVSSSSEHPQLRNSEQYSNVKNLRGSLTRPVNQPFTYLLSPYRASIFHSLVWTLPFNPWWGPPLTSKIVGRRESKILGGKGLTSNIMSFILAFVPHRGESTVVSGGSRGGARAHPPPPLFLDQSHQNTIKDGTYHCYCAYILRISRYSGFLSVLLTNTVIFLRGLKLSWESRS